MYITPKLARSRSGPLSLRLFGIAHFATRSGKTCPPLALALERSDGSVSVFRTTISADDAALNQRYAERLLKFLLWQKGGYRVTVAGDDAFAA